MSTKIDPQITALDTETYKGKAFLLSSAQKVWPISSFEDFMLALAEHEKRRFVFYNIDYDVSALLKFFPRDVAGRVYLKSSVRHKAFTFRYIPGKIFSIVWKGRKYECFDLFPFFQCSLDSAAQKYLGEKKEALPAGLIADLSPENYVAHKELIDKYAIQDSALLQSLCNKFYESVSATGLKVRALYSPGYLAKAYCKKRSIKMTPLKPELAAMAESVFFGGRIEVVQRGTFETAHIYDLKSAYPWALAQLPALGERVYYSDTPETRFYLAEVETAIHGTTVAPFAMRQKGLVIYPNGKRRQWITSPEFETGKYNALRFLNLDSDEGHYPFRNLVNELFALRASGGMESLVYKLILNSLYGVLAEKRAGYMPASIETAHRHLMKQQLRYATDCIITQAKCPNAARYYEKICSCDWCAAIRLASRKTARYKSQRVLTFAEEFYIGRERPGKASNRLLASFVTGIVRAEVYKHARRIGAGFIGAFTDSLLVEKPLRFSERQGLGAWEHKYSGPLTIVGSGVYETDEETKFRGFRISKGFLREALASMTGTEKLIPQRDRLSLGRMIRLPFEDYTDFNEIKDVEKKLDLNFDRKRIWARQFEDGRDVLASRIQSTPLIIDADPARRDTRSAPTT